MLSWKELERKECESLGGGAHLKERHFRTRSLLNLSTARSKNVVILDISLSWYEKRRNLWLPRQRNVLVLKRYRGSTGYLLYPEKFAQNHILVVKRTNTAGYTESIARYSDGLLLWR